MLIFQYGSNCLDSQLNGDNRLRGDAKFMDIARADGFELAFNVWSRNRGCAASDIIVKHGSVVWGALYEIPDHLVSRDAAKVTGRRSLDAIEGEGINYRRQAITVMRGGKIPVEAVTYIVITPASGLETNITYVGHIIAGLRERGIDLQYIDRVKAIASANNPAIAMEVAAL